MTESEVQLQEFDFKGNSLQAISLNNEPWFIGKDVATILGYKNVSDALSKHVRDRHRKTLTYKESCGLGVSSLWTRGSYKSKVLISMGGIKQLVSSSNMPNAIELCKYLGIETGGYNNVKKEQRTLLQIMQAFSGEDMQRQYSVSEGKYRIDLYFPKYKLAIECDEYGHRDRPAGYDETRQQYIEDKLGCHFIRYNPDSKNFSIFKVINRIIKYIYK